MLIPVLRKLAVTSDTLIERALPIDGSIYCKEGQEIKPFDRLGECLISHKKLAFPLSFRPLKLKSAKQFYYRGAILGNVGSKKITAPFDGYILAAKNEDKKVYTFEEAETRYQLLAGVWGSVQKVFDNRSVLMKTETKDLIFAACTNFSIAGELVVFPNPTEILEEFYLEEFAKEANNKIVYVGNYANLNLVKKAVSLGVGGIIAGSTSKSTFAYAKSAGLGFGIISGFGKIQTPEPIFKLLSMVSYRQVFYQGERNLLRVPIPNEDLQSNVNTDDLKPVKSIQKDMEVQVFQPPYVGKVGVVDSVGDYSIFVRFDRDIIEVKVPNFYIIE